jgi:bacterioferritin-associated ferredoxin
VIVCLCHNVSHRRVLEVVDQGAETVREIGESCGAGTDCGSCVQLLQQTLDSRRDGQVCRRCSEARPADQAGAPHSSPR